MLEKRRRQVTKTIKARYRRGVIEPLEKLDIEEGKELLVTLTEVPSESSEDEDDRKIMEELHQEDREGYTTRTFSEFLASRGKH